MNRRHILYLTFLFYCAAAAAAAAVVPFEVLLLLVSKGVLYIFKGFLVQEIGDFLRGSVNKFVRLLIEHEAGER